VLRGIDPGEWTRVSQSRAVLVRVRCVGLAKTVYIRTPYMTVYLVISL